MTTDSQKRVGFAPRATSHRRVARRLKTTRADKTERSEGLAERVGFEPTCRLPDKTLSRRPRYDHFGTSPVEARRWNTTLYPALCSEELLDELSAGLLAHAAAGREPMVEARSLQRAHG